MAEVQGKVDIAAAKKGNSRFQPIAIALGWCVLIAVVVAYDQQLKVWWDSRLDGNGVLDALAYVLTKFIAVHVLALAILLWSMFDARVRWRLFTNTLWIMAAQGLLIEVLKHVFARLRPDESLGVTIFCGPTLTDGDFGFPSGHATASFALAVIFSAYYPRWRWLFIVGACLVSLARVQMGRHFLGDTLAGGVTGWYLATLLLPVLWRYHRKRDAARQRRQLDA